jgi:hypothetical protein
LDILSQPAKANVVDKVKTPTIDFLD